MNNQTIINNFISYKGDGYSNTRALLQQPQGFLWRRQNSEG